MPTKKHGAPAMSKPSLPKSLNQLCEMFFSRSSDKSIAVNNLTDQILMLNMLTIDMRLSFRLIQLRTTENSWQPMYWAQPMLEQLLRARLVDIRKITESHKPNQPHLDTLAFPHLLYLLDAHHANTEQKEFLKRIQTEVWEQHNAHEHLVNKYIVHAATVESRMKEETGETTMSVAQIWQSVLVLNHVFYALFRYVQQEHDMNPYPHTVPNHLHDMQRYFLLTEPEYTNLQLLIKESTDALDAIQSMSVAPPWQPRT